MGLFDLFGNWAIDALQEAGAIDEAAAVGFDIAISMCANEGQTSVIEMTESAFYPAAEASAEGFGAAGTLIAGCPYPEAVSMILEEAGGAMDDYIAEVTGEISDSWWVDEEDEWSDEFE